MVVSSDRTRGSEHKLKQRWFPLNIRKHFTVRKTEHCHGLPREFIGLPFLEIFRGCLDTVVGTWLQVALLGHSAWTRWCPEVPSSPAILWFCLCASGSNSVPVLSLPFPSLQSCEINLKTLSQTLWPGQSSSAFFPPSKNPSQIYFVSYTCPLWKVLGILEVKKKILVCLCVYIKYKYIKCVCLNNVFFYI